MDTLIAAAATFVAGHFVLAAQPVRVALIDRLGENGFRILFSLVALVTLVWTIKAWADAPYHALWVPPIWAAHVPLVVMPFAAILVVAGQTTPNATSIGGERVAEGRHPAPGIMSITRHPVLCGVTLWALSHLAVNGGAADLVLFGGLIVLAVGGMIHIDRRRQATLDSGWGPIALTTSAVPFLAALQGRCRIDWAGIGLWRPALGVALYFVLLWAHAPVIGVSPLPA